MFDHSLPVELSLPQSSSKLVETSDQVATAYAPLTDVSQLLSAPEQPVLGSSAIAFSERWVQPSFIQASPLLPSASDQPSDSLLGPTTTVDQPLVGALSLDAAPETDPAPALAASLIAPVALEQLASPTLQNATQSPVLEVAQVLPGDGTTNINTQASIRVQFASEAIDAHSLTSESFKLLDASGNAIAASIDSDLTGGVISLAPQGPLNPFSTYSIVITEELLNTEGEAATPFSTSFTTGAQGSSSAGLRFTNENILNDDSQFGLSSIAVGPDDNVYVSDILGNIHRYNLDPSTGLATSTETIFSQAGAQIVGIAFDPNATAANLELWFTYAEPDNTGFSGTISKLELPAIPGGTTTKQDYITGLPNSIDLSHQPNGITFGPDGKLYQTVGGVATLGGTPNWGIDESLLSAAVIVADVNSPDFPTNQTDTAVDVQTVGLDVDGDPTTENYDPFAADAPVQIFATGLRNAFDLAWHSNGNLYSGINQNSIGGNVLTPASPDGSVPAINAKPNEMLALIQTGNYYGHPNPSRGEYVLNGGNPTAGVDPKEVTQYPVGVQPNPNFDASLIYDTRDIGGTSPNGLTEYTSPGELNGQLLVSFFSGTRAIQSFELGEDGLVSSTQALQDPDGNNLQFRKPLDVAVHPNGRIYVAAFGFGQNNPNGSRVRVLTPVESPAVIITPTSGNTEVVEAGATDSYTVALATQPSGPVSIAIAPDNQLDSDASTLDFTPSNWNIPQTVTVSAVDDSDIEGAHSGSISHSITSGSGDYGTGLAIASLTATITDNDDLPPVAGLEIVETDGSTAVTEGGNSDSLGIRLTAEPESDVTLTLSPGAQLKLGLANSEPVALTFTPANWDSLQNLAVDAVDDEFLEGEHTGTISYAINSEDSAYGALEIEPTIVSITDNEVVPSISIIPTGRGTFVSEDGLTDNYKVTISSQPTTSVRFNITTDNDQLSLNKTTFTFTPTNWERTRNIQIRAVDDALIEEPQIVNLIHSATSNDSRFDGISIDNLAVNIEDNDLMPRIIITPTGRGTSVEESGRTDNYKISISDQPTTSVRFNITTDNDQISLNKTTFTFTPNNWERTRTVQISAVDDALIEGQHTAFLSHSATSNDSRFDGISIDSLAVTIEDNDTEMEAPGPALFIADTTQLADADVIAHDLLVEQGYDVTVISDESVTESTVTNDINLVLISQSVQSTKINTKLTSATVPIILWESFLYDDLGMANSFGVIDSGSSLTLTNSSHPLSGGLPLGNTVIYQSNGDISWGNPSNNNAISIAHTGNPDQLAIFGYEAGVLMENGLLAPAKRIGLSFWETPDLTGNNEALLEAAIAWAVS